MTAEMLDGSELSKSIRAQLKGEMTAFAERYGAPPTLAVLRAGDDSGAAGYGRAIERTCSGVGAAARMVALPESVTQDELAATIRKLNADAAVHGIMLLEPTPAQIDLDALIDLLDPAKDVDGVHTVNAGRLYTQRPPYFVPATPAGAIRLLEGHNVSFRGARAVMVGRSNIVGKPMALLLLERHCTVTIAHSRTVDLPDVCRTADILCVGVGRAEMVKADWVKPGAVVVDFGTNYTDDGLKGDCDQAGVAEVAGMLTPVPGGTGPMTNAMLMSNLLAAAKRAVGE